jgi:adenosylcobinamide kinase/adenosylcobinamide-phosphate guanylyltransferase
MRWLAATESPVILVSNEVGGGIVPASTLARRFQSEQGWLNQDVANLCEEVTLVVAGLPVPIKRARTH